MRRLPFVLPVDSHAPHRNGNVGGCVVSLAILESDSIREGLQLVGRIAPVNHRRIVKKVVIAHVVATEVFAELEGVVAMRPGEVVDDLILRDVTALGERSRCGVGTREVIDALILAECLLIVESGGRIRSGELGYVMAERGGE